MSSKVVQGDVGRVSSCFQTICESKKIDTVFLISILALVAIGVMASTGVFNFMGTTHAAYLAYGMYGGAALLGVAEIIKLAIKHYNNYKRQANLIPSTLNILNIGDHITSITLSTAAQSIIVGAGKIAPPPVRTCRIEFTDGKVLQADVSMTDAYALAHDVGYTKCFFSDGPQSDKKMGVRVGEFEEWAPKLNMRTKTIRNGLDVIKDMTKHPLQPHDWLGGDK